MGIYVICYGTPKNGVARETACRRISQHLDRQFPGRHRRIDSSWVILTNATADKIRDDLAAQVDGDDKLLVVRADQEAAWSGFEAADSDWLLAEI